MAATLILRDQEYQVEAGTTIIYALVRLGIDIRIVSPMRDGKLISVQENLQDGDVIKLVPIIAGG
jgi:sulfur carrier protein ThiS